MRQASLRPQRPRSLRPFLAQALRHLCPGRNDQVPLRIFNLVARAEIGEWVSRDKIALLWPQKVSSDTVSKGIDRLRKSMAHCFQWIVPHCLVELAQDHKHRPTKYRLVINPLEPNWFLDQKFMETLPWTFSYRFPQKRPRTLDLQVWANAEPDTKLDVEVQRVAGTPTWKPPHAESHYTKVRDEFFRSHVKANDPDGLYGMHDGDIWGIQDVSLQGTQKHRILHLKVMRTKYSDGVFLKQKLEEACPFLPKHTTYRQYLAIGDEPLDNFHPPIHCLCLSVVLVAYEDRRRKTGLHIFLSRQARRGSTDPRPPQWDLTAAGVVSSTRQSSPERMPRLRDHVRSHLLREVGVPSEENEISWLGFARTPRELNSTLVALAEVKLTPGDVKKKFDCRPMRQDVDELVAVKFSEVLGWLDALPRENRREFLEAGIALTAIRYGKTV